MENANEIGSKRKTNLMKVVLFKLGEEEFGLDISKVLEIGKIPQYTKVPGVEEYVEGVINLRGKIIAIVNLNKKLGFPFEGDTDQSRIIVVEIGNDSIGLRVDLVKEVLTIDTDDLKPTPPLIAKKMNTQFIRGIVILGEKLVVIVDVDKIITADEVKGLASAVRSIEGTEHSETDNYNSQDSEETVPAAKNIDEEKALLPTEKDNALSDEMKKQEDVISEGPKEESKDQKE